MTYDRSHFGTDQIVSTPGVLRGTMHVLIMIPFCYYYSGAWA